jgi:hypothetical protein
LAVAVLVVLGALVFPHQSAEQLLFMQVVAAAGVDLLVLVAVLVAMVVAELAQLPLLLEPQPELLILAAAVAVAGLLLDHSSLVPLAVLAL